ncbi:hypothetical protein LC607_03780 [Nostoc sp. CHAB 5824]|nr:hypothetical protein [Nostoc sp. CHAB 5824]
MDSSLSGEQCVGEPARMSSALWERLPPRLTGVDYSGFYFYQEASYT